MSIATLTRVAPGTVKAEAKTQLLQLHSKFRAQQLLREIGQRNPLLGRLAGETKGKVFKDYLKTIFGNTADDTQLDMDSHLFGQKFIQLVDDFVVGTESGKMGYNVVCEDCVKIMSCLIQNAEQARERASAYDEHCRKTRKGSL